MDKVLSKINNNFLSIFIDDIICYSGSFDLHIQHLKQLFQCFAEESLKFRPEKCEIGMTQIDFLSHNSW